ncbi:hypothetical protein H4R99_007747 [Coemansia sp. RSA 1722]|nr:hypothetical protein LPJ57_003942 [Coemansia sp. RSA 486]KAJ2230642.1 hypothetical protein IWW45_005724 [Coemansia sp. RSA 485]KAJ2588589.1 hypothetical protein H4R99_007747 [Coemansia sp. RSA 1722]
MSILNNIVSKVKHNVKKLALLPEQLEPYVQAKERVKRAKRKAAKLTARLEKSNKTVQVLDAQLCDVFAENRHLKQLISKQAVSKADASCNTEPIAAKEASTGCCELTNLINTAIASKRWSEETKVNDNNSNNSTSSKQNICNNNKNCNKQENTRNNVKSAASPTDGIIERSNTQHFLPSIDQQLSAYLSLSTASQQPVPCNGQDSFSSIINRSHFIINAIDKRAAQKNKATGSFNKMMANFCSKALDSTELQAGNMQANSGRYPF